MTSLILLRQPLQYVTKKKKLPLKAIVISDEDDELLVLVRNRLANPQKGIKFILDELDVDHD
jgi:RHH-type transcriptional regulator, rel operon repressor / antitoxin RelB